MHNNGLWLCIYLVCYVLALGYSMLESQFKDFQEQVFEEPEVFFSGQQASVLEQHCTYYLLVYSVVCRNCMVGVTLRAPMLMNYYNLIDYSLVTM
jgi:hypothetical protein